jgi:hypothetical protein
MQSIKHLAGGNALHGSFTTDFPFTTANYHMQPALRHTRTSLSSGLNFGLDTKLIKIIKWHWSLLGGRFVDRILSSNSLLQLSNNRDGRCFVFIETKFAALHCSIKNSAVFVWCFGSKVLFTLPIDVAIIYKVSDRLTVAVVSSLHDVDNSILSVGTRKEYRDIY